MRAKSSSPPKKSLLVLGVFTCAGLAILCGLGIWQLQRLEWKQGLIAAMQARMNTPAAVLPPPETWPELATARNAFRKFTVTGTFDHARETYVFRAAAQNQIGPVYHVVTPLRRADGSQVLINRGFVPEALRDPAKRPLGQVAGRVTITGYLRLAEKRNMFTPADNPAAKIWYSRDPKALIAHLKLDRTAPFILEADSTANPGGWPKGGVTRVRIPNNHLSYAWTWFGLAATLLIVFLVFVWRAKRGETSAPEREN